MDETTQIAAATHALGQRDQDRISKCSDAMLLRLEEYLVTIRGLYFCDPLALYIRELISAERLTREMMTASYPQCNFGNWTGEQAAGCLCAAACLLDTAQDDPDCDGWLRELIKGICRSAVGAAAGRLLAYHDEYTSNARGAR